MTNRIALVLPWSGPRPWYWDLWHQSAAGLPFDILTLEHPLSYFESRINETIKLPLSTSSLHLLSSYKLCDYKPLYGEIFAPELAGYDYWAFGDCDVLYGPRLASWLAKVLEGQYDVATVQSDYCAGPFTLIRNTPRMNTLWRFVGAPPNLQSSNPPNLSPSTYSLHLLSSPRVEAFDELGPNWFRKHIYGGMSYDDLRAAQPSFSSLVWNEAAAGRLKLLAEQVIDEHPLKWGEIIPLETRNYKLETSPVLYHFISAKLQFGFSRVEHGERVGVGLSRSRAVRDALRFAFQLLATSYSLLPTLPLSRPWARASECAARHLGSKTWWKNYPWNNR